MGSCDEPFAPVGASHAQGTMPLVQHVPYQRPPAFPLCVPMSLNRTHFAVGLEKLWICWISRVGHSVRVIHVDELSKTTQGPMSSVLSRNGTVPCGMRDMGSKGAR